MNSKYIKTKRNRKLEAKFFGPLWMFHPVGKQAYKLELPKKWKIHNVFYISLLKQNTIGNGRVDKKVKQMEFDVDDNDNGEYKIEAIWDSAVYTRESELSYLPSLYYLIS